MGTTKIGSLGVEADLFGCKQEGLIELIEYSVKEFGLDVLVGPEWMFLPKKRLYNKEEKNAIIADISKRTESSNCLVLPGTIMWHENGLVSNTMPIIANGQLIEEYHKWSNGGTSGIAEDYGFRKKDYCKQGTSVKWKGLDIGLEICLDHGRRAIKDNPEIPDLDLQIIPACGGLFYDDHCKLKEGRYALWCNGDKKIVPLMSEMRKNNRGKCSRIINQSQITNVETPYKAVISIYNLQFPAGENK